MADKPNDRRDEATQATIDHPFLKTQLTYDHTQEFAPSYTRALWKRQHAWISGDIGRFKPSSSVRLLDVGCGPAHISESQNEHIDLYFGVDPSFVELSRAKPLPRRFLAHGIGEYLDYLSDNSFDVVVLVSVLDHCIDWKRTIDRCASILRPGGLMLVVMENSDQLVSRLRRLFGRPIEHADHMHYINLDEVLEQLGTGFTALKARTFGYGFGLHTITTKIHIPQPVFETLIPVMDSLGSLLLPSAGQVLYGCYQKKRDGTVRTSQDFLVCPSCKATLTWGADACWGCGLHMPYQDDILDALALLQKA